jgi:uncharacterized protein
MRAVLDTNGVISALFWSGAPRKVMDLAHQGIITLYTSTELLIELADVLSRDKWVGKLETKHLTPADVIERYSALARTINASALAFPVSRDRDDDAVLACAIAAQAHLIISGDKDLRVLHPWQGIDILNPADALQRILTSS